MRAHEDSARRAVQKPAYVIALDAPVAAGDVIAEAFVRSALSASLVDVSEPEWRRA